MIPVLRVSLFLTLATAAGAAAPTFVPPVSLPRLFHPGAGQVLYFVLTDRFANGDPRNDTGGIPGGPNDHGFDPTVKSHFHGGDFAGLVAQLDYIKQLGATAIWVTPPFRNKPVQQGTAGYHGYWVLDFLAIDPHLGSNADFRSFVAAAHARGIRVYMDIITNHTADVIQYAGGDFSYRDIGTAPDRDVAGGPVDPRGFGYNGIEERIRFPAFDAARSFALTPVVPPAEIAAKHPAWLNDVTLYHNRGNTTFTGENSLFGDFVGLDDLYTENPRVVQGFIDIYQRWIDEAGVDGFRIDTAKHVNREFWQAFGPAIRTHTRAKGRNDFISFGEVMTEAKDVELLSAFSTSANLDTTIDFAFLTGARDFVSKGGDAAALARLFERDDLYTDHDSNVHSTVTCLGNHDLGRFGWFLEQDNPGADAARLLGLSRLGHGLMFLVRGQPTVYYGDEQGMIGSGNDMAARETMFASRTPLYRNARLLGTTRTGADDKFDPQHPLFRLIRDLAALRAAHPAFARGAMLLRPSGHRDVFTFSRIERTEGVEYVVALNNSRTERLTVAVPTCQPANATLRRIFDSASGDGKSATVAADGRVLITLDPLQFSVWRADAALPAPGRPPTLAFATLSAATTVRFSSREVDGQLLPLGREIRVDVDGNDGFAEVTFVVERRSRPGVYELLGTDDAPPYRVFWQPSPDLAEDVSVMATVDDLRGHRIAARVDGIRTDTPLLKFGIEGATAPRLTTIPATTMEVRAGDPLRMAAAAEGTPPLEFQWLKDGREIADATAASLEIPRVTADAAGRYTVMVRNRAGTVIARETIVALVNR